MSLLQEWLLHIGCILLCVVGFSLEVGGLRVAGAIMAFVLWLRLCTYLTQEHKSGAFFMFALWGWPALFIILLIVAKYN